MKARLTRTMVVEYELLPEYYPEGSTFEEMAQFDAETDDRESLFDFNLVSDEIRWELIDEKILL